MLSNQKYLWLEALKFNAQGLIPGIIQDRQSREILKLIWLDRDYLREVIETREIEPRCKVSALFFDCDADVLLFLVEQSYDLKHLTEWIELCN